MKSEDTGISDCKRVHELMTSYVDGALDSSRKALVDRHVDGCPPCGKRLEQERGGRAAVRAVADELSNQPMRPGFERRCAAVVQEYASRARSERPVGRLVTAGIAAIVLLAGLALLTWLTRQSNTVLAAQLTADHVKCFALFEPRGTTGDDPTRAERQLASFGWHMRVPSSSPQDGLHLLGVRRCFSALGGMPHVMYDVNGRHVSLFKLEGTSHSAAILTSFGHQCRIWRRDGGTFVLVAPEVSSEELTRIARYFEDRAH